jgi:hypothetical protein
MTAKEKQQVKLKDDLIRELWQHLKPRMMSGTAQYLDEWERKIEEVLR